MSVLVASLAFVAFSAAICFVYGNLREAATRWLAVYSGFLHVVEVLP